MTPRGSPRVRGIEWAWSDEPILLPLAFQPREWNAAYVAVYLAEYSGSKFHVLHVETGREGRDEEVFKEELRRFAYQSRVEIAFSSVEPRKRPPSVGEIASRIVEAAKEKDVQAIVMSAQRERFFTELFGRVSDRVARAAPSRVILVETPYPGLEIPRQPRRILIPILRRDVESDPFIVAAALTSSATIAGVEVVAARFIKLPLTTPLDAVEASHTLRRLEREFSREVGEGIRALGRIFTPRIIPVRDLGPEVAAYARDLGADLLVMECKRPPKIGSLLSRADYDVVKSSACPVVVTLPVKEG